MSGRRWEQEHDTHTMKTVAVIGPQHCGSTMVFNAIREAGLACGIRSTSLWCQRWRDGGEIPPCDLLVLKDHHLPADLLSAADHALVPVRHPVDALLTHIHRYAKLGFGESEYEGWTLDYCRQILDAPRAGAALVSYEFCTDRPGEGVEVIAGLAGLELRPGGCRQVLARLEQIKGDPDMVSDDLDIFRDAAMEDNLYQRTLTTRAHFTAGGATDKWKGCIDEPWCQRLVTNPVVADTIHLCRRLRSEATMGPDRPPAA